ncbi:thylakoid membrane photosystem I accumulation factor [Prochlorococcus sp. MIT 1300]|uniref:thylakoid membrane photosystem I accumulation factor n=1 Tax=Prochlorococcus sp. MIT 1300 TaxID=3096218 RepID=UPI002A75EB4C|nr:thylakoid membrane photosystem I accumulation factor [Prochlorococcus sp. MIT 1300]
MTKTLSSIFSLVIAIIFFALPARAARDTDSYDGNIFPIYAGNGSLVPPPNTLAESLEQNRTSVVVFYLDDSSTSKTFAPVLSGIKLLWGPAVDLLPITTDNIQGQQTNDPKEEAFYWHGKIPQVVVIDGNGKVWLDQEGQVPIDTINTAISSATGLEPPSFSVTIKSFNEYNSEPAKEGYTDPR